MPLTPKLAVKANTISTPTSRAPAPSQNGGLARVGHKEEPSTPVNAFLLNNVTPRSSSRKSRVDSSQNTPNSVSGDTPNGDRARSPTHGRIEGLTGLGFTESPKLAPMRPKSQVSGLGASPMISGVRAQSDCDTGGNSRPQSEVINRDDSPNFFHASNAKTQNPAPRHVEPRKAPTFFYADGREEESRRIDVPSPAVSAEDQPRVQSRFFHADGSADQTQGLPLLSPPISVSSSRSSFINSPTQAVPPLFPTKAQPSQARAASPPKEHVHLSYRKGASQIIPPTSQRKSTSSVSATSTPVLSAPSRFDSNETPRRRPSAASSAVTHSRSHTKTVSMSSIDITPRKSSSLQTSSPISPPTANSSNPASPSERGFAAPKASAAPSPTSSTWPRSPTKPATDASQDSSTDNTSNSALRNVNELAAKARQDRKVLDLEISNSSLLAINRSLEREIRKQKAELRRFRRLTRKSSMRNFSLASTGRSTSYGTVATDSGIDSLGDGADGLGMDEDFEDEDFDSEDYSEDSEEDEDGEGGKEKDARRLRLDLSKHRELLVDSQKLNQSIKRCVGFTEELISQGRRALEYKVRVSDVKLGGRVLSEDEDDHETDGLGNDLEDEVGFGDEDRQTENDSFGFQDELGEVNGSLDRLSRDSNRRTVSFERVPLSVSTGVDAEINGDGE
ncbi:MAG: hypothetical protein Q9165_001918 [Trypethelium subeluteriae]